MDLRKGFSDKITNARSIEMDIRAEAARRLIGKYIPSTDPKPSTPMPAPQPRKGCGGCMGRK